MYEEDEMDWFDSWRMALFIELDRRLIQSDNALKAIRRMYKPFSKGFDVPFLKVLYEAHNHQAADQGTRYLRYFRIQVLRTFYVKNDRSSGLHQTSLVSVSRISRRTPQDTISNYYLP